MHIGGQYSLQQLSGRWVITASLPGQQSSAQSFRLLAYLHAFLHVRDRCSSGTRAEPAVVQGAPPIGTMTSASAAAEQQVCGTVYLLSKQPALQSCSLLASHPSLL